MMRRDPATVPGARPWRSFASIIRSARPSVWLSSDPEGAATTASPWIAEAFAIGEQPEGDKDRRAHDIAHWREAACCCPR